MSACISQHGEYSDHDPDERFTCKLCGAFDETGALAEVDRLQAEVGDPLLRKQRDNWKAVAAQATEERDEARAEVDRLTAWHPHSAVGALRLAKAEAERDRLAARAEAAEAALVELKPADVLVEGTWFPVGDLPTVLGNFMRSSSEHARQAKALAIERDRLAATVERVRSLTLSTDGDDLPCDFDGNTVGDIRRALDGGRQS